MERNIEVELLEVVHGRTAHLNMVRAVTGRGSAELVRTFIEAFLG